MAEYRTIRMSFWYDPYVESISARVKLLYLYLITSCPSNLGLLEISPRKIAFETASTVSEVELALQRLEEDGKIAVDGNSILLLNFIRHQTSTSPMILKGLKKSFHKLNSNKLRALLAHRYPFLFDVDNGICYLKEEVEDKEEEEEKLEEKEEGVVKATELIELWNEVMPKEIFARARGATPNRRVKLKARQAFMSEAKSIEFWKKAYYVVRTSPFLRGELGTGKFKNWKADFDFLLTNDDKLSRLIEGKYDYVPDGPAEWVAVNDD